MKLHEAKLARRDDLGGGNHVLHFEGAPIEAEAGQFVMVRAPGWGDAPLLPRPMSLLTAGDTPSILIKVVGEGTGLMAEAPIGSTWNLLAPLGRPWALPADDERPVLIGGGVGIAPLAYLARTLVAAGAKPVLLYGGRRAIDLPLAPSLEPLGVMKLATEDGSRGHHGRVTELLTEALAGEGGDRARVYCCGPHGMMAAVAAIAQRHGRPCDASLEAPMACGIGICLGCPVAKKEGGYLYTCVDGPCVDAATIDWEGRVF